MSSGRKPWILGLSTAFHSGAACLLRGDEIVVAVQEERLTRVKRARLRLDRPSLAIDYCLAAAGIGARDLDVIVDCTISMPQRPAEEALRTSLIASRAPRARLLSIPHHLGHALSAFATSGLRRAAVLVIDGGGSFGWQLPPEEQAVGLAKGPLEGQCEHLSLYHIDGRRIEPVEKHLSPMPYLLEMGRAGMPRFASFGHMFSSVSHQIFGDYMEAGKVMALAALGRPRTPTSDFFVPDRATFRFLDRVPARYADDRRWPDAREEYQDLAASVQKALERGLAGVAARVRRLGLGRDLCYAGGVALNSVANHRVLGGTAFDRVHIVPSADDGGTAIGAAYYGAFQEARRVPSRRLSNDFLGRRYTDGEIRAAARAVPGVRVERVKDFAGEAVERLCSGQIVAWFQGGSEFGPRALGHRSILCDPRRHDGKDVLNGRVKHREPFRPFAPAVIDRELRRWFDVERPSRPMAFMLEVCRLKGASSKLVPAVAHADGSGRVQTVAREDDPPFHSLLRRFQERTGVPVLVNTSFNVMGEPIVETPRDALWCLLSTGIDCCFLDGRLATRDGTVRSVLDLVPERACRVGASRDGFSAVRVSTVAGPFVHERVSDELVGLLELFDGKASARRAFASAYGPITEEKPFARQLGEMFRFGMLRFRRPLPSGRRA